MGRVREMVGRDVRYNADNIKSNARTRKIINEQQGRKMDNEENKRQCVARTSKSSGYQAIISNIRLYDKECTRWQR